MIPVRAPEIHGGVTKAWRAGKIAHLDTRYAYHILQVRPDFTEPQRNANRPPHKILCDPRMVGPPAFCEFTLGRGLHPKKIAIEDTGTIECGSLLFRSRWYVGRSPAGWNAVSHIIAEVIEETVRREVVL